MISLRWNIRRRPSGQEGWDWALAPLLNEVLSHSLAKAALLALRLMGGKLPENNPGIILSPSPPRYSSGSKQTPEVSWV